MTAEVAVLNSLGVALAADSAVSVGRNAEKIWTSAEKLFELSLVDPVGAMIYGNAHFLGMPWETVIKAYRRARRRESLRSVDDHAKSFLRFLARTSLVLPSALDESWLRGFVREFVGGFARRLFDAAQAEAEAKKELAPHDVERLCQQTATELAKRVSVRPVLAAGLLKKARESKLLKKEFDTQIAELLGDMPLGAQTKRILLGALRDATSRQLLTGARSGLVFAGFGRDESLPSICSFEIDGRFAGSVRAFRTNSATCSAGGDAMIFPFAQLEMVKLFMEGIDPTFFGAISKASAELSNVVADMVVNALGPRKPTKAILAAIDEAKKLASDSFVKQLTLEKQRFWAPVISNVASLPKDELASTAEALVNLTKFRRRASTDRETVGGPIDVAVITKGDGFVWVKRKHYFQADINVRAIAARMEGRS